MHRLIVALTQYDEEELRALLEEAVRLPGPHHSVSSPELPEMCSHIVLTTNDGATFTPKRVFITEHSGLLRDLLADADEEEVKEAVPLPNVAACELKRILWLLRQGFDATQLERCIAVFDFEGVIALQEAANFMDVQRITAACGGVMAQRVRKAADDEERTRLLELVTPPWLPQELCELWMGRFSTDADELLEFLTQHRDQLLAPLAHWDAAWADKGRFSEYRFQLSDETEFTLLKKRSEVVKQIQGVSALKASLHKKTNDDDLRSVVELPQLTSLDLSGCKQITDEGLSHLKVLKKLTALNLDGCKLITVDGLVHLKVLKQLTSLNLSGCKQITSQGELFAYLLTGGDPCVFSEEDVTWKLPDGTTLLHVAAQKNIKNAVEELLVEHADMNAVDDKGRTPLQLAVEANATDAIRLLQEKGAQY